MFGHKHCHQHHNVPCHVEEKNEEAFRLQSQKYEDALNSLQLILIVDRSGSQSNGDAYPHNDSPCPTEGVLGPRWTQWDNTLMVTRYLAKCMFAYDKDGNIPLIFFDNNVIEVQCTHPDDMYTHFNTYTPCGSTNLYGALEHAFSRHIPEDKQTKALFIVLTDGCPDAGQEPRVKQLIKQHISKKDPGGEWLSVLFVRIGDSLTATRFLEDMDDCKSIGKNVDTKTDNEVYGMGPKNLILNAIYEHLETDCKKCDHEHTPCCGIM
eukprot:GDKI01024663.1.p1 GENE.GDKI01024663.1~~GDKI01024663.1.p1  ORF type:complete len:265 (-),score=71.72 GDKI01024663.1:30-824(-)